MIRSKIRCLQIFGLFLLLSFQALVESAAAQDERQTYQSLQHALFSAAQLAGDPGPQNVTWIDGGERFSYMVQAPGSTAPVIRVYDPESGADEVIFDPYEHTFPGSDTPFTFQSFQWSADFQTIIFQSNFSPIYRYSGTADYFYYSLQDERMELIAGAAFTAELSPDGHRVAFHRDGELFLFDLESGEEHQLTQSAEENLYNGRFGWVYEEEFSMVQAWSWSHDSRYIAYWKSDERHVERFVSTDFEGIYPEYTDIPYPKAGERNPDVEIHVIDTETGNIQKMNLPGDDTLIPRIYWTATPGKLAVVEMNRVQNHLKLHMFDVESGEGDIVMEEQSSKGWIDVYNFFAGVDDHFHFPENSEEFFWMTDRDGFRHIYRYKYDGELINQVTNGDWEVSAIHAVNTDFERIWYTSTKENPLERHLYSVSFDGSDQRRYTETAGYHSIDMGPDGQYYLDYWSNTETPLHAELHNTENGGSHLHTFTDNGAVSVYIDQYEYSPRELFSFTTEKGVDLDGYLIKPHDFDPDSTYPLVMMIYGGPGAQGVTNEFETNLWHQFLAQRGYIIANVNNRGSGGYGHDFEKAVYLNLGIKEAEDYAATAEWLASHSWVDRNRMAIRGHSYGGYMAALTMVLHPRIFKAGIVAAPVTDWRLYDTIYTERYMGLPEDNFENYEKSSVMAHTQHLQGSMLVAHSSMDENVHIQNTMQMVTAFTNTGKDVELRIYPKGDHGVAYNQQSFLLLHQVYTNFLNRHLRQ